MSINEISKNKKHELNFTQECIILANILNELDKIIINSFYFIPVVKLYTANQKQEAFCYSKIKGGLFLLQNKITKNYFIRIYDSKDYSLKFNLEINSDTKKNYMKVEPNFYCFNLKFGILGIYFFSVEEAETFKKIFDEGIPEQSTKDEYEQNKLFKLKESDNIFSDSINYMIAKLEKIYEYITLGEKLEQQSYKITDYLIFSGFNELSHLLSNTEYDIEDKLYNIFVDKKYPLKLFKKMFRHYDMNQLYPLRPIFCDYLNIYNKPNYVDILVSNLTNNFKEQVEIYKKRKENYLKEKNNKNGIRDSNISLYSNRESNPDGGRKTGPSGEVIEEDPNEYTVDGNTKGSIGRFFSGIFK